MVLDDVMTQADAAKELRLSLSRIGQLVAAKEIESVPLGSRQKLLKRSSVEALAKRRREEAAKKYGCSPEAC